MTKPYKGLRDGKPKCRWTEDANGCWVWPVNGSRGYATAYFPPLRAKVYVYTVHYIMKFGPVPVGFQLDHTCKNRACVNPDHLEAVTQAENLRRGCRIKFNMETARAIRADYARIKGQRGELTKLARKYKMDLSHLKQIAYNRIWREESNWRGNR